MSEILNSKLQENEWNIMVEQEVDDGHEDG